MTPTEYEHYVAALLVTEGWDVRVSPPGRDFGLDIVCEQSERRLGVQVKMYGNGRPVNAQIVMQLHGAAAYQDCTEVMVVTNGRVLDDVRQVAKKLGIRLWHVPISDEGVREAGAQAGPDDDRAWDFDRVWEDYVMPLTGKMLVRSNGSTNEILSVDWSGLTRKSSNGRVGRIEIEIFRWTITRLLDGEVVLRKQINDQYQKRASSGIVLILGSLPMFEIVKVAAKQGLRWMDPG